MKSRISTDTDVSNSSANNSETSAMATHGRDGSKRSKQDLAQGLIEWSEMTSLEQRIMLDAAAPVAMDAANDVLVNEAADEGASDSESPDSVTSSFTDTRRNEAVFLDSTVEGHDKLLADLEANADEVFFEDSPYGVTRTTYVSGDRIVDVFTLDGTQHGFDAVSHILSMKESLDAVHILSHGGEAQISMGDDVISDANIDEFSSSIEAWGDSIKEGGDILLYGCNVGNNGAGVEFIQRIAALSDADIAASDDLTGQASLGGDWQLEVASGEILTNLVVGEKAAAAFSGLLIEETAVPQTTLSIMDTEFLGETVSFTVTFDNAATDGDSDGNVGVGYAPYVDVIVEPGLVINGASYVGSPVDVSTQFTWSATDGEWQDGSGNPVTEHPFGPSPDFEMPADPGLDGATWFVVELPFGSFTYNQPPADIVFSADLDKAAGAVVGTPINVTTIGGFRYGSDPLANPDVDPPLVQGTPTMDSVTPVLLEIEKDVAGGGDNSAGQEDETATGPNHPITWQIEVDIADGETVENIVITDFVPNDFFYTGNLTVAGAASGSFGNVVTNDGSTAGAQNGNQFTVTIDEVTGTGAENDILITYTGYVPEFDADNNPVLDPSTGAPFADADAGQIVNEATINADYDDGTGGGLVALPPSSDTHSLEPEVVAIQKNVQNVLDTNAVGNSPGDTLEWTIRVQVSDYFSAENFNLTDVFSDGQVFDASFTPTWSYVENGTANPETTWDAANFTVNAIDPATGLTTIDFRLSDQLGGDGVLDGDLATDATADGRTAVEIKFRTVIQEEFQHPEHLAGDASVDVDDIISNNVTVTANIAGTSNETSDGSSDAVQIVGPSASKQIYAIDGDTEYPEVELTPGGSVTYRITVDLPSADIEALTITDFLPLPVFEVSGSPTYAGFFSGSDNVPAVGQYGFISPNTDPSDFPAGYFPSGIAVSSDSGANTVTWDFGSIDVPNSTGGTIDLIFTVQAVDTAFADGLNLTNQAAVGYNNSNNPQPAETEIVQITLAAPDLNISKGIVALDSTSQGEISDPVPSAGVTFAAANAPGPAFSGGSISSAELNAEPFDSSAIDVDAGDTVRFALVVENTGGGEAHDITIRDTLPAGFASASNVQAILGDGTVVSLSNPNDLFTAGGLTIPDYPSNGVLQEGRAGTTPNPDGDNLIIITYDAIVDGAVNAGETVENTAEILAFAGFESGADYTAGSSKPQWSDDADTVIREASLTKEIISTTYGAPHNDFLTEATVGEEVGYRIVIDVPEGEMPLAQVFDQLPAGMRLTDISVSMSAGVTASSAVYPALNSTGQLVFNFGTVTNSNTDNSSPSTILIDLTAIVENIPANNDGDVLTNTATLRWDVDENGSNTGTYDGNETDSDGSTANNTFTIVEPDLNVTKSVTTVPGDYGDAVTYQIVIEHDPASTSTAYRASIADAIPAEITPNSLSVVHSGEGNIGPSGAGDVTLVGNQLQTNTPFDLEMGETVTIIISGVLDEAVSGSTISNTADLAWTSALDSKGGTAADIKQYSESSSAASYTVISPTITKAVSSTSIDDSSNGLLEVTIGEYIDYSVSITVPEGDTQAVSIIDQLPAGVELVSVSPTLAPSGVTMTNYVPPAAGSTGTIVWNIDNISNLNSSNGTAETVSFSYRVLVTNDASIDRGDVLSNQIELRFDTDGDGSNVGDGSATDSDGNPTNSVTVVEPELQAAKTITASGDEVGETIDYQIVVSHTAASNTTAYDLEFNDTLPSGISPSSFSVTHSSLGDVSSSFLIAGNSVVSAAGSNLDLAEGETLTVNIVADIDQLNAGQTLLNVANVSWESLNEENANDGDESDERDNTDGYTAQGSTPFTAQQPSMIKSVIDTGIDEGDNSDAHATIGEYVYYRVVVTVPDSDLPNAVVTDVLDAGLEFDTTFGVNVIANSGDLSTDLAGGFAGVTANVTGQQIMFDLGNVNNASDSGSNDNETITLEYRVWVVNDPAVDRGDLLGNRVELNWDSQEGDGNTSDGSITDSDGDPDNNITVVEAQLQATKTLLTTPVDAGDAIQYQIVIEHTALSDSAAYDLDFTDVVPSEIAISGFTAVHSTNGDMTASGSNTIEQAGNTIQVRSGTSFDLAEGETVTIVISGTVANATVGNTVTNVAEVLWTSLDAQNSNDGHDPNGDREDDRGSGGTSGATGADGYSATGSVDYTVDTPTLTKRVIDTGIDSANNDNLSQAVVGEYVQYEVAIEIPEGNMPLAELIDTLDVGLAFVSLDSVSVSDPSVVSTDLAGGFAGVVAPAANTTGTFNLDLGNITNIDVDDGPNEVLTIQYTVKVLNDAANVTAGTILDNSVEYRWDANEDGDNTDSGDDGSITDGDPSDNQVTVLEPVLELTKSSSESSPHLGETITYSLAIENLANANGTDAFDVRVADTLPAGMTLDVSSILVDGVAVGSDANVIANSSSGNNLDLVLSQIDYGTTVVVSYEATITTDISQVGSNLVNSASSGWSSLDSTDANDGDEGEERGGDGSGTGDNSDGYSDGDGVGVTLTAPDLVVSKDDGLTTIDPSSPIVYTITYSNQGTHESEGVVLTETLPQGTSFDAGSSTAGWAETAPGSGIFTFAVGTLNPTDSGSVAFAITTDATFVAGQDDIANSVTISDDGTNGPDSDPDNNDDDDTTSLEAEPDLAVTKTDAGISTSANGIVVYQLSYANNGSQEATNVVITESAPAGSSYDAANSSVGWTESPPASGTFIFNIASLPAGASGTVNFAVQADASFPSAQEELLNTASITDDGTNGVDPTPGDNTGTDTTPIVGSPDLYITKDDGGVQTQADGTVIYTLNYGNDGTQDAVGVVITETAPSVATFDPSNSTAGWVETAPGSGVFELTIGAVDVGDTGTVTFAVTADSTFVSGQDDMTNSVSIADDGSNGPDEDPSDNSDDDDTPINAAPDLVVTKTDGDTSATPTGTVAYLISYSNQGTQDAVGTELFETLPAGTTFDAAGSDAGWTETSAGSGVYRYLVGALATGASGTVTFSVTVDATFDAGIDQLENSVTINDDGSNGVDEDPSNNQGDDTTPLDAEPDLAISKDDGGIVAEPGDGIVYGLNYVNNGSQAATGVVVQETVPVGTTFDAANSSAGWVEVSTGVFELTLGTVAAGASGSLDFAVIADDTFVSGQDDIVNTATISDDGTNGVDPTPGDNTGSDDTPLDAAPNLAVSKDDGSVTTLPNGIVTYTIDYANNGPQDADAVVIRETLPVGSSSTPANNANGWVETFAGSGIWEFSVGSLASGATGSVQFSVAADATFPAGQHVLENTVEIEDDGLNGADEDPSDNSGDDDTPIDAAPDLSITKSDGDAETAPNGSVVYTLDFANNGNQGATGVVVTEQLPAGTSFDAANSSAGWIETAPGSGVFANIIGAMPVGATGSLDFAVIVDATVDAGLHALQNTATINDDGTNGPDLDPSDNTGTDDTPVDAVPDLTVSKDDGDVTVLPEGSVVYTINYANNGEQGASNVTIIEQLPLESSFDAANSTAGWVETSPGVFELNVGTVAALQSGSVNFAVIADAIFDAGRDDLINTVQITDDGDNGPDADPSDNSDDDNTPIDAAPDYRIQKVDDVGGTQIIPGQTITYTITVENIGPQNGTGIVVSDTWPTAVFEDPSAISHGGVYDTSTQEITWNFATLDAGESIDITVTADVRAGLAASIVDVTNSVEISDDGTNGVDPDPTNNDDDHTSEIDAALPNYAITKESDNTEALEVGQLVEYTLTIVNNGNQEGTNVVVEDTFPTDVFEDPTSISNGGTFDPATGIITWNIPSILSTETVVLSFEAAVKPVIPAGYDTVINGALVYDDGSDGPDPDPSDNTTTDEDVVNAAPDYVVTVSNDNTDDLEIGETTTYVIDYTNQGTQDGTGVEVVVTVPDGVFLDPDSISNGGVYDPATGTITWVVGDLDVGETGQFTFDATVQDVVEAGFDDAFVPVSIFDDGLNGADLDPSNNDDSIVDPVDAAPIYVATKDDGEEFQSRMVEFSYQITVGNEGTQHGTGVVIVDTFDPDLLEILDADGGVLDQAAGTITWTVAALDVGEVLEFEIDARVKGEAIIEGSDQRFFNTVTVTDDGDNGEDEGGLNEAVDETTLLSGIGDLLSLTVTSGDPNARPDAGERPQTAIHHAEFEQRDWEYNSYPFWYHGRLISLETMQMEANLVAARTEVAFDNSFGQWNHHFYPNPWNHLRGDGAETEELLASYEKWTEIHMRTEWQHNPLEQLFIASDMQLAESVDAAPESSGEEATEERFAVEMFEKLMRQAAANDDSGAKQFEQADDVMQKDSAKELLDVFRAATGEPE